MKKQLRSVLSIELLKVGRTVEVVAKNCMNDGAMRITRALCNIIAR